MKLISELDKKLYKKFLGTLRRTGDKQLAAQVLGVDWLDTLKLMPPGREAGHFGVDVEDIKALRRSVQFMKENNVPRSIIDKLLRFYKNRKREWVSSPADSKEKACEDIFKGKRLATMQPCGEVEGLISIPYQSHVENQCLFLQPEHRDIGEYLLSVSDNRVRALIHGLAFGYPVDRVWHYSVGSK